jgi:hypothetical protein
MRLMLVALAFVVLIVIDRWWYQGHYTSAVSHAISQTISR